MKSKNFLISVEIVIPELKLIAYEPDFNLIIKLVQENLAE
jgi:hypothetical protein